VYKLNIAAGKIAVLVGQHNGSSCALQEQTAVQCSGGDVARRSTYVTTNCGELNSKVGTEGVSRIDVMAVREGCGDICWHMEPRITEYGAVLSRLEFSSIL
jgi:hypothetical protein